MRRGPMDRGPRSPGPGSLDELGRGDAAGRSDWVGVAPPPGTGTEVGSGNGGRGSRSARAAAARSGSAAVARSARGRFGRGRRLGSRDGCRCRRRGHGRAAHDDHGWYAEERGAARAVLRPVRAGRPGQDPALMARALTENRTQSSSESRSPPLSVCTVTRFPTTESTCQRLPAFEPVTIAGDDEVRRHVEHHAADLPARSTGARRPRSWLSGRTRCSCRCSRQAASRRGSTKDSRPNGRDGSGRQYRPGQDAREDRVAAGRASGDPQLRSPQLGRLLARKRRVRRGLHAGHERDDELLPSWVPAASVSRLSASSTERAFRYGRVVVIASNASATARIRR